MAKKSDIAKSKRVAKFSTQQKNRCHYCGRPRSYLRKFAMCRLCFRLRALMGDLPGVTKSSW